MRFGDAACQTFSADYQCLLNLRRLWFKFQAHFYLVMISVISHDWERVSGKISIQNSWWYDNNLKLLWVRWQLQELQIVKTQKYSRVAARDREVWMIELPMDLHFYVSLYNLYFNFPASTVSDTGIGSNFKEFQELKYGNNTVLSGKWGK